MQRIRDKEKMDVVQVRWVGNNSKRQDGKVEWIQKKAVVQEDMCRIAVGELVHIHWG